MLAALFGPLIQPFANASPPGQRTDRVAQIISQMTTRQKVAQLFMVSLWGAELTYESQDFLANYQPGGVILFGNNLVTPSQITTLTNDIQTRLTAATPQVPAWIATDQEGGLVSRLQDGFTIFPVNLAIAATGQPDTARAVGQAMAEELRAVGFNMDLAPVADVETNPDNPVIARRAFSADPEQTATMVAAVIEGLQQGGVLATAKHFPGHGATVDDSHITLPVVAYDRARLDAVELVPFRSAIDAGVGAIMAAHIAYPALDPTPDMPASLSPAILDGLLRTELGYQGLIMTDALDMDAIDTRYSLANAARRAIEAGADLVTPGPHVSVATQQGAIDAVIQAVEAGEISIARIEQSVQRILTLKAQFGVLDWSPLDPASTEARLNRPAHEALIAATLSQAVTLAYDRASDLPLDPARRLVLVYPATLPSVARSCEPYAPEMQLVGVSQGPTAEEINWATVAAQSADVIVVFTYDAIDNPAQQQLVHALPPERTIVVALRSPYDWQVFPDVTAYLATYTPLPPVIPAACAALFGGQPVSGQLAVTLSADLPAGSGVTLP